MYRVYYVQFSRKGTAPWPDLCQYKALIYHGPTTRATDEETARFYQDLSQAVKQVPKRDMLLIAGDFNAKVGRREPSTVSPAVGLYGLGETNEAGEQLGS